MSRNSLLFLVVTFLFSCKKEVQLSEAEIILRGNCTFDGEWFVQDVLINEVAEIGIYVTERNDSLYQVKTPKISGFGEAGPCHLPERFKKIGLKVVISGKVYNHPRINFNAPPILLNDIEMK